MFNDWKWYEMILLAFYFVIANIIAFPCFVLQSMKIKCVKYANWLNNKGYNELTIYDIYVFRDK